MKALVKALPEKGLWLEEVAIPQPGHNEVLIKVKSGAICGTDLHIYQWDEWAQQTIKTPLIIGHEFLGEVIEIGKEVTGINIGDRVSGEGHISCGFCRNCRAGRRHICRKNVSVGITRNGCFAEYLTIPATNTYPIPANINDEQATILDPLGNAVHCALLFNLIGEDVLITGAGPVGTMAALIAQHVKARHVILTDINPYRLDLAKKIGIECVINTAKTPLGAVMDNLKMVEGFDIGLEMSGSISAFTEMVNFMNHNGKIALLGFLPQQTQINWHQVVMKGLTLQGVYGREMFETWYKMIAMLSSGLKVDNIITHTFSFLDFEKAFLLLASGHSGKIILNW